MVLTSQLLLIDNPVMNTYKRHRVSPDIIIYAVWLYHRFNIGDRLAGTQVVDGRDAIDPVSFVKEIFTSLLDELRGRDI